MNNLELTMPNANMPLTNNEIELFRSILYPEEFMNRIIDQITKRIMDDNQIRYREFTDSVVSAINNVVQSSNEMLKVATQIKDCLAVEHHEGTINKSDFQFVTKLSDGDIKKWRSNANRRVRSIGDYFKMSYGDAYIDIYKRIAQISGIDVNNLHKSNANRFINKIDMISHSDVLMQYFDKSIESFRKSHSTKNTLGEYDSIAVKKCPNIVKEQISRYFGRRKLSSQDYFHFYKAYNNSVNLNYVVESAKAKTGYKNINRGFAILLAPNGYEKLVKFVDNKLNTRG